VHHLVCNALLQAGPSHVGHVTELPDLAHLHELEDRLEFERLGFSGDTDAPGSLVLGGWMCTSKSACIS
jgi:hypothetical protein